MKDRICPSCPHPGPPWASDPAPGSQVCVMERDRQEQKGHTVAFRGTSLFLRKELSFPEKEPAEVAGLPTALHVAGFGQHFAFALLLGSSLSSSAPDSPLATAVIPTLHPHPGILLPSPEDGPRTRGRPRARQDGTGSRARLPLSPRRVRECTPNTHPMYNLISIPKNCSLKDTSPHTEKYLWDSCGVGYKNNIRN